jgi:hypothetical protein
MTPVTKREGRKSSGLTAATAAIGLALMAAACSSGGGDDAAKFAGPWTFASGQLAATCPAPFPTPAPFDLKGLSVSISRVNNGAIDLVAGSAAKCTVHFTVSGDKATASPVNQLCKLDVGGALGEQTLTVKTWTLDWAAERLTSTTSALVLGCMLDGSGVLSPGGPDGGVSPSDGGDAKPAPMDAQPDLGTDVATSDAGTDTGTDTGTDAGSDASDAGGDTGA